MANDYNQISGFGAPFNPYQVSGPMVPQMTNTNDLAANSGGQMGMSGGMSEILGIGSNYYPPAPNQGGGFMSNLFGGGGQGGQGGGFNWNALGNISNLIGGLGGLYSAFQGAKIAKQGLALQTEAYRTNLANQTKSYNTALSDRARSRGVMEGSDSSAVDKYIKDNSL